MPSTPAFSPTIPTGATATGANRISWLKKADYLCLRDVSLYYDLPEHWLRKIGIRKVTVGVTGNTLCYWTGVTGAISPESGIGSNAGAGMYTPVSTSNSNSDITANMMPVPRKIIFSLKLVF